MEIARATDPDPRLPLALEQHPDFAAALRLIGRDAQFVKVVDADRPLADVLMITRRVFGTVRFGLVLRGPVWAPDSMPLDRVRALRTLRRAGVRMVEAMTSEPALHDAGFRQVATAAHVASLDLTGTAGDRRRALEPESANKLRKAERAGLVLSATSFGGDPGHWLMRAEAEQRRARRYRTLPHDLTCAFCRAHPGQAVLYQATLNKTPVAGMLMLRHGPVATYHIGWSGPAGRATAAHQALLMMAADDLAARGHVRLDLGTVDTEAAPGLARFKLAVGATVHPLGGSWLGLPGL